MSTPYRDAWRQLPCPRCADALEELGGGVAFCALCEGLWIAKPALARLDELPWPVGSAAWWRNELACPECAAEGTTTIMQSRMADDILVDQCAAHGGWFDRGELARLVHFTPKGVAPTGADDFAALRARIAFAAPSPEALAERRAKVRAELEARRAAALAYDAATTADAEQARLTAEHARLVEAQGRLAVLAVAERERARAEAEAAATRAADYVARKQALAGRVAELQVARAEAAIALEEARTAARTTHAAATEAEAHAVVARRDAYEADDRVAGARARLADLTAVLAEAEAKRP